MKLELYQSVALSQDIPEHQLKKGDIVTLVDYAQHPNGGEDGYVLEVFNAVGDSILVLALPMSYVEPLRANELLTVRAISEEA